MWVTKKFCWFKSWKQKNITWFLIEHLTQRNPEPRAYKTKRHSVPAPSFGGSELLRALQLHRRTLLLFLGCVRLCGVEDEKCRGADGSYFRVSSSYRTSRFGNNISNFEIVRHHSFTFSEGMFLSSPLFASYLRSPLFATDLRSPLFSSALKELVHRVTEIDPFSSFYGPSSKN